MTSIFSGAHTRGIGSVCSQQNGNFWNVISGGNDQLVKFWKATPEEKSIGLKLDKAVTLQAGIKFKLPIDPNAYKGCYKTGISRQSLDNF